LIKDDGNLVEDLIHYCPWLCAKIFARNNKRKTPKMDAKRHVAQPSFCRRISDKTPLRFYSCGFAICW